MTAEPAFIIQRTFDETEIDFTVLDDEHVHWMSFSGIGRKRESMGLGWILSMRHIGLRAS